MNNPTQVKGFKGKVSWAKVLENQWDEYMGQKSWSINFFPDEESKIQLKQLKLNNRWKYNTEPSYNAPTGDYIAIKRPVEKKLNKRLSKLFPGMARQGEDNTVYFEPPVLIGKDGEPLEEIIRNGADVHIKVEVYEFSNPTGGKGQAIRLVGIKLLENGPEYEPLEEETKPNGPSEGTPADMVKEDSVDDLPF